MRNEAIRDVAKLRAESFGSRRIKWAYATQRLDAPPATAREALNRLQSMKASPRANDVIVAEVATIGQHERIELADWQPSTLFPGDLVGVAYGRRYATRQWRGIIPKDPLVCHMLSVAGLCGQVVDAVDSMREPTLLRPLGYLMDGDGKRVNLEAYGLRPDSRIRPSASIILVVGSSMDSGKTTAAYSIINGLTTAGKRVCSAKLTGTASVKDLRQMRDAGAMKVLDFTNAGFASTAGCSREQLMRCATGILSNLSALQPDYVVLEIADGIIQRETKTLLGLLQEKGWIDYVVYTCIDDVGMMAGVERLREYGFNVVAISGLVACSPLAVEEAQPLADIPVLRREQLRDPGVVALFPKSAGQQAVNQVAASYRGVHGHVAAGG